MSRDSEAVRVARELDSRLDDLRAVVDALSAILKPPAPPEPGAADERMPARD